MSVVSKPAIVVDGGPVEMDSVEKWRTAHMQSAASVSQITSGGVLSVNEVSYTGCGNTHSNVYRLSRHASMAACAKIRLAQIRSALSHHDRVWADDSRLSAVPDLPAAILTFCKKPGRANCRRAWCARAAQDMRRGVGGEDELSVFAAILLRRD